MASLVSSTTDKGGGRAVEIRRVGPGERRLALSVLLTGRPSPGGGASVDQFLGFAEDQKLSLNELWAALEGDHLAAASLLVPSEGRTAMLILSPVVRRAAIKLASRLVRAICQAQDPARLRLIQSLLDPGQTLERRTVEQAGFIHLTELVYMQRSLNRRLAAFALGGNGLEVLRWSEANRRVFSEAILASYEHTRDCPELQGLRHIDDVIAGHMATGRFDPELWLALRHGDKPVGVVLLNEIPQRGVFELVYLGVTGPYRRQGWGRRLVEQALALASASGGLKVLLAVDERNSPAVRLYRSLRFRATAHKTAMIFTLK